jgi:hypothetical protein
LGRPSHISSHMASHLLSRKLDRAGVMRKGAIRFACVLAALMIMMLPAMCQTDQNATSKIHVLRLGSENVKPINSENIMAPKSINRMGSLSMGLPNILNPAFNLSQRTARAGRFSSNTSIYKPMYNASTYSIKPIYEIPSFLKQKPVYDISGYPSIKAPNSIP